MSRAYGQRPVLVFSFFSARTEPRTLHMGGKSFTSSTSSALRAGLQKQNKKIIQSTKKPFRISQMRTLKIHPKNKKCPPVASSKLDDRPAFRRNHEQLNVCRHSKFTNSGGPMDGIGNDKLVTPHAAEVKSLVIY